MKISEKSLSAGARNELNILNDLSEGNPKLSDLLAKVPEVFLLTASDLSRMFDVDERTIYRWRHEALLPDCVRIKSQIYWRLSDIRMFIKLHLERTSSYQC